MPKQKITREMVIEAAFELARKHGLDQVTVRDIAEQLGCSVQPIYSYCKNMEGLRKDVKNHADSFLKTYIASYVDKTDFFRSMGQTYIRLATEEANIFKMFITNERENIDSMESLYHSETNPEMAEFIANNLEISIEKARKFHLNMLIYTMGMGTILANVTPGIGQQEAYRQLEFAYEAFLKQIKKEDL